MYMYMYEVIMYIMILVEMHKQNVYICVHACM